MSADYTMRHLYEGKTRSDTARSFSVGAGDWGMAVAVWIASVAFFLVIEAYLQNTNVATTNGLWQSVILKRWLTSTSWTHFIAANALYYPVYGFLCRILGHFGVLPGFIFQQMAELNAVFGGLGLAAVYLFVVAWQRRRSVALLATVLYGGSAFYLLLSVISEYDIVPDVFVLAATLMACAWFARPRTREIAIVAITFSIGWLFGWHFLFPSLPPLILALILAAGRLSDRFTRPATFLLFMAVPPVILAMIYYFTSGATVRNAFFFLIQLFWVGKGVGTGWGGFAAAKFPLAGVGAAESLIGARNLLYGAWSTTPGVAWELLAGGVVGAALLALALHHAWQNRNTPSVVTATIILGGTLGAGLVFNLYSQPQDPEMVISVMLWTVPAWALVANAALGGNAPDPNRLHNLLRRRFAPIFILATLAPLAYNISALAAFRGQDPKFIAAASRLAHRFDLRRTVFLYQGFEFIITWQFVLQDGIWTWPSALPLAPSREPTFKMIATTEIPVNHPRWSPAHQARFLKNEIDAALDRHYQVVVGGDFLAPEREWIDFFMTVAPPAVPRAMRQTFNHDFQLTAAYHDPLLGEYDLVTRKGSP